MTENLKEVPSLVKGKEDGIQKDDPARGPIPPMGSVESGDSWQGCMEVTIRRGTGPGASAS